MTGTQPKSSTSRGKEKPAVQEPLPEPTGGGGWARVWMIIDRFGWDILGVILLSLALLTLLGLAGWTKGTLIDIWNKALTQGMGWGSFSVVILFGLLGLLALRRRFEHLPSMQFGQILALEGFFFVLLVLFSLFGGVSLENARAGEDGGVIGWGLASLFSRFLPDFVSIPLLILLGLYFALLGFGLARPLVHLVDRWLAEPDAVPQDLNAPAEAATVTAPEKSVSKIAGAKPKKVPAIQPEEIDRPAPVLHRDDRLPPLNLLMQDQMNRPDEQQIRASAEQIEKTLSEFGVPAKVVGYRVGPTVTQFAVEPGFVERMGPDGEMTKAKIRVAQISALSRDLTLALSAERLRIEAPVPGRTYVGIEIPNLQISAVRMRSILESETFQKLGSPLAVALGRDVSGLPVVADLARMPHMLIAGTTGSGKSVCIAALTACLVANNTPDDLRIAMLDPKMVELVRFNGLPHLLGKVETEQERMLGVLRWALAEMDTRYRLLENAHARDLDAYNHKMQRKKQQTLPRIVVLIDELADLMMSAQEQTEHALVRLAQMARAIGIHLVVATQRPSTEVVTGLIKANFPARISFTVASSIDSRVILDTNGAETLLGKGDMLFINPEVGTPQRAQGVMVTDAEIDKIINFWQKMSPKAEGEAAPWEELLESNEENVDSLVEQAVKIVRSSQRASASMLQRRLRIGYPRAAHLIDELEELGVVGPSQGGGREREVLLPPEDDTEEAGEEGEE